MLLTLPVPTPAQQPPLARLGNSGSINSAGCPRLGSLPATT